MSRRLSRQGGYLSSHADIREYGAAGDGELQFSDAGGYGQKGRHRRLKDLRSPQGQGRSDHAGRTQSCNYGVTWQRKRQITTFSFGRVPTKKVPAPRVKLRACASRWCGPICAAKASTLSRSRKNRKHCSAAPIKKFRRKTSRCSAGSWRP